MTAWLRHGNRHGETRSRHANTWRRHSNRKAKTRQRLGNGNDTAKIWPSHARDMATMANAWQTHGKDSANTREDKAKTWGHMAKGERHGKDITTKW